jgi:signal transduction histidine kinase
MSNTYLLFPWIQAILCFILSLIVLRGHLRSLVHWLFSLLMIDLVFWGVVILMMRSSPDVDHALQWERWIAPLAQFLGVLLFHFSLRYHSLKTKSWLLPALYIISIIFIPLTFTDLLYKGMQIKYYGYAPIFGPLMPFTITLSYSLGLAALVNFIRGYRRSSSPEIRNRSAYIICGLIIMTIGGTFDVLPVLGLPLYPGMIIGNIIFCLITTTAIIKHNLLDIRIVVRKSVAYFLTSAAMSLPVIITFLMATYLISESALAPWFYLLLVIILAFTLPPLWKVIQKQVDRWFYRGRYDYLKALEAFGWHSQSLSDTSEVNEATVRMLAGALRASNVYLFYPLPKSRDFVAVCDANGSSRDPGLVIRAQSPVLRWLERSSGLLRFTEFSVIPQLQNVASNEQALLERIGIDLIVPLRIRGGKLSGLVLLGKKLDGQPYNVEDIQMLAAISNPIAVTLENMRLYRDIFESRKNLETWLNSMGDPVIIVDDDLSVQFMNQAAKLSFGDYSVGKCWQFLGKNNMCLDCPMYDIQVDNRRGPKRVGTRTIGGGEYEVATAPLLNPDSSQSIIEVFRDVTERKRLEKEIIQAQVKIEALKQSERLKTDLLSMVSHELRTPLALIKGQTTSLLRHAKKWKDPEKVDSLRDIDQATDSLSRLVGNLLDMSILDAGTMKLEKDYYQISEILEGAAKSLKVVTRGHVLNVRLPPDLPAVLVDRARLGQVLINLCENAAKYSDAGSQIYVEGEASVNEVLVSVIDEGEGISPENRERVFDKFFRIANNKSSATGIGLGLSICRGIVQAHGGQIHVESANGRGSRFVFSLPVNRDRSMS